MNTATKKVLNIALKIVTWMLVAFTVFMMVFTVVTVATVNRNDRNIFGYKFFIVRTDSMSLSEKNAHMDVHFDSGDIIIARDVADKTVFQPGDIITFISTNGDSYGKTITHMIREVETNEKGKVIGYVTFGTNKDVNDEAVVEPEYILGVYRGMIPEVGNFMSFVKTTPGYILCILVPFLLLILYNGVNVIRLFRKYRREQMEEMQAERDQINAERAETQRMMQELLALKAQLDQKNSETTPTVGETTETTSEIAPDSEASDEEKS